MKHIKYFYKGISFIKQRRQRYVPRVDRNKTAHELIADADIILGRRNVTNP